MRKLIGILSTSFLFCSIIFCSGCPSRAPTPEWHFHIPEDALEDVSRDPESVYASATAESKNEQMAIDSAKHDARVKIARFIESGIQQFIDEAGYIEKDTLSDNSDEMFREIILKGCKVSKQEVDKEGSIYRASVLMKMPVAEANSALVSRVKADGELYSQLRALERFRELEAEVEEYQKQSP